MIGKRTGSHVLFKKISPLTAVNIRQDVPKQVPYKILLLIQL